MFNIFKRFTEARKAPVEVISTKDYLTAQEVFQWVDCVEHVYQTTLGEYIKAVALKVKDKEIVVCFENLSYGCHVDATMKLDERPFASDFDDKLKSYYGETKVSFLK